MSEGEPSSEKVSWNMAALLNLELAKLRNEANSAFIQGRYRRAVDSLRAMCQSSIHVMNNNEREKLKAIEQQFEKPLMAYDCLGSFNLEVNRKARLASLKLRELYNSYNTALMDILNRHGFLGDFKEDSSKMRI